MLAITLEMMFVDRPTWTTPKPPFDSTEHSGHGRELSSVGTQEFAHEKLVRDASIDPPAQTSPPATLCPHTPQTTGSIRTC